MIRTKEFLQSLGMVNVTPRVIEYRENVSIRCSDCGTEGRVQFGNALTRHKKGVPAWRCKPCVNKGISEKQKLKVGELNPFFGKKHSEGTKEKIRKTRPAALEKSKATNRERYGVDFSAQSEQIQEKSKQTNQERYGSDWFMGTKEFAEKSKETINEKYGVDNIRQLPETITKSRNTNIARFGVDSFSKTEKFKEANSGDNHHSRKKSWRDKYANLTLSTGAYVADLCNSRGLNISNGIRALKQYGEAGFIQWLNKVDRYSNAFEAAFLDVLVKGGINAERWNKYPPEAKTPEGRLPYRPDFKVEQNGMMFYINGDGLYPHSERMKSDNSYHLNMRIAFEKASLRLFQFRSDEVRDSPEVILSILHAALGLCQKVYARECVFQKIRPADGAIFFKENHLMGNHNSATPFGLFYRGRLIACMSVRRNKKSLEISRFACLKGIVVIGGFTKLLDNIVQKYEDVEQVVSFCDLRYFTGRSYKTVGFEQMETTLGFSWTDGKHTYNRRFCRSNMDERGLSEAEYAAEMKIYKIYDAGQAKFAKKVR